MLQVFADLDVGYEYPEMYIVCLGGTTDLSLILLLDMKGLGIINGI